MKTTETCDNCKYFVRHYAKRQTGFHALYCGHCKHIITKNKAFIQFSSDKTCDNWQPSEENQQKQQEDIQKVLRQAAKDIQNVAYILKELYENK